MQRSKSRADPVSCQSCRAKKLRCNRVQPCSNCTSRRITCIFIVPPDLRRTDFPTDAAILGRLERLESLVLPIHVSPDVQLAKTSFTSGTEKTGLLNVSSEVDQDFELLDHIEPREDSLVSLIAVYCKESSHIEQVSASFSSTFAIHSTHNILQTRFNSEHSVPGSNTISSDFHLNISNSTTAIFPPYDAALSLLQSYESNVDHVCRILHLPTMRSLLRSFYLRLNQGETVPLGQAAMLLAMFALAAYFYQPSRDSPVARSQRETVELAKFWSNCTLNVLDETRRQTQATLEDIQAHLLMTYVTYHLDGPSRRGRDLAGSAASIAKELKLHRLDADGNAKTSQTRQVIDLEIKRRIFWHIVATDW